MNHEQGLCHCQLCRDFCAERERFKPGENEDLSKAPYDVLLFLFPILFLFTALIFIGWKVFHA